MGKNDALWKEAKKRCRLNEEDIQLAKQLGMSPKSLLKNIPSKSESWKAPVKVWIRDLAQSKNIKVEIRKENIKENETYDMLSADDRPF